MTRDSGHYFVVGTSHALAPGEVRERFTRNLDGYREALQKLIRDGELLQEAAVLSTCGRLEIYGVSEDPDRARRWVEDLWARSAGISRDELSRLLYYEVDRGATTHLFRVAAGLESAIQGEVQILGQVKRMLDDESDDAIRGSRIHRLVERAISAGKRVRNETRIGRGSASLAGAALGMLGRRAGSVRGLCALVLGAGETGRLMAELLVKEGAEVIVANRTRARANRVAADVGGEGRSLDELPRLLARADIVVGSVGEVGLLVTTDMLEALLESGSPAPRWFLDLAHPRNLDPGLDEFPEVVVLDLERVERSAEAARHARAAEVPRAEAIVREEAGRFHDWARTRPAVPKLRAVREQVLAMALDEAVRYGRGLEPSEQDRLEQFARSLARTILHRPTVALREADPATDDGRNILHAADAFFGLGEDSGLSRKHRESA